MNTYLKLYKFYIDLEIATGDTACTEYFIGLNNLNDVNTYTWTDGTPVRFTYWSPGNDD